MGINRSCRFKVKKITPIAKTSPYKLPKFQRQTVPAKEYRKSMQWNGMKERISFNNGETTFKILDSTE
jgi:hypothetical protein